MVATRTVVKQLQGRLLPRRSKLPIGRLSWIERQGGKKGSILANLDNRLTT